MKKILTLLLFISFSAAFASHEGNGDGRNPNDYTFITQAKSAAMGCISGYLNNPQFRIEGSVEVLSTTLGGGKVRRVTLYAIRVHDYTTKKMANSHGSPVLVVSEVDFNPQGQVINVACY